MKATVIAAVIIIVAIVSAFLAPGLLLPVNGSTVRGEQDRFLDVLGSRIRYRMVDHQGPTLIMLHGFGGDLSGWEPLISRIACARMISLDLIGFGLSDRPPIAYDLDTQRRYLVAFMDRMNIKNAVLVGTSMGASIALWTAARSPERVAGLVLFAPSAYPGSMRHRWPGDLIYRPGVLNRAMRVVAGSPLYDLLFPRSLGRQALDVTASYTGAFTEGLNAVHQPLLLVWSRGDKRVPFSYTGRYRELLPQAQFIEAPREAGHGAAGRPTSEIVDGVCRIAAQSRNK
jgi:pimeloyl-ACP methyl ester carboxylesterase